MPPSAAAAPMAWSGTMADAAAADNGYAPAQPVGLEREDAFATRWGDVVHWNPVDGMEFGNGDGGF